MIELYEIRNPGLEIGHKHNKYCGHEIVYGAYFRVCIIDLRRIVYIKTYSKF